jgi:hypothetical protein
MPSLFYSTKTKRRSSQRRTELNSGQSQTLQDETLSIRDLLARYQSGMQLERKKIQYFDEEDISAISKFYSPGQLDLTDLDDLAEKVDFLNNTIQNAMDKREAEKNQKEVLESSPTTDENVEES